MPSVQSSRVATVFVATLIFSATSVFSGQALAEMEFDQDVTPDVIFGSGNANGAFTTDRRNNVEIGLRGKLRFDLTCTPQNVFNSNGDGSYSFDTSVDQTGGCAGQPVWAFEWSANSDLDGLSGRPLDALTYEIGLDGDPGFGTNFLSFDPIIVPCADNALGTNLTANGGGSSASCPSGAVAYQAALASDNVAQNSWRYNFFTSLPNTPLSSFDPNEVGIYDIYLLARNAKGRVIAYDEIRILVGTTLPEDAEACKDGGWMSFEPSFKNQGACISYVNTGM